MNYLDVEDTTEKILFLGLSQSGKTSIIQVVFEGILPEATKTNQASGRVRQKKVDFSGKIVSAFEVGGQISYLEDTFSLFKESVYSNVKYMFFILDSSQTDSFEKAQYYYTQACNNVIEFNDSAKIILFAHKFDLVSEDEQINLVKEIREFFEIEQKFNAQFFTTSIYNDSIFEVLENLSN